MADNLGSSLDSNNGPINFQQIHGVLFDMDGTLVDSRLDFHAMREEMRLQPDIPILEQLANESPDRQAECSAILDRYEMEGAERAKLITGAAPLLSTLRSSNRKIGLITRNSKVATRLTLERLEIGPYFDIVVCREDGPPKPDPWSILAACKAWEAKSAQVVMVGDFELDIATAHNAGCPSILYSPNDIKPTSASGYRPTMVIGALSELMLRFTSDHVSL